MGCYNLPRGTNSRIAKMVAYPLFQAGSQFRCVGHVDKNPGPQNGRQKSRPGS